MNEILHLGERVYIHFISALQTCYRDVYTSLNSRIVHQGKHECFWNTIFVFLCYEHKICTKFSFPPCILLHSSLNNADTTPSYCVFSGARSRYAMPGCSNSEVFQLHTCCSRECVCHIYMYIVKSWAWWASWSYRASWSS